MYDIQTCEWNWGQTFFILLSFVPLVTIIPTWIVAHFIWLPFLKRVQEDSQNIPPMEIPYEYRYPIEEATNARFPSEKYDKLMKQYTLDDTPDGSVVMRYNPTDEGFEYWTDKTVAYKYLETVARKYVTMFSCSNIYINRGKLLKEKLTKLQEEINENKKVTVDEIQKDEEEKDSVFATLKSNKANKPKIKTKITRDDIVCEKSNKFMKRGKLNESPFYEEAEQRAIQKVGFSEWKKCFDFGNTFTIN